MAQWLRASTTLAEDLGSIPSTSIVAKNHLYLQFYGNPKSSSDLPGIA